MSTPFTSPYKSDVTWQDLLDEITRAYLERGQACGIGVNMPRINPRIPRNPPEDNIDVQAAAYWLAIQDWVESACLSFVDHVNGPLNANEDGLLMFTLTTFRAAAGLHADGFRRATEWTGTGNPSWSYGKMQADNIIGPWVFEELQKSVSAMWWSLTDVNISVQVVGGYGTYEVPSGFSFLSYASDAKDDALAVWPDGGDHPYSNGSICAGLGGTPSGWARYNLKNSLVDITASDAPSGIADKLTDCLCYLVAVKIDNSGWSGFSSTFEGYGLTQGVNILPMTQQPDDTWKVQYGSLIKPTLAALPTTEFIKYHDSHGYKLQLAPNNAVRKWDFTNQG